MKKNTPIKLTGIAVNGIMVDLQSLKNKKMMMKMKKHMDLKITKTKTKMDPMTSEW
jgi:hypothetical protein